MKHNITRALFPFVLGCAAACTMLKYSPWVRHWLAGKETWDIAARGPNEADSSLKAGKTEGSASTGKANDGKSGDKKAEPFGKIRNLETLRKALDDKSPFAATAKVQQMILGLSTDQIQAMVKESTNEGNWYDDKVSTLRNLLLQRWTEVDSSGALGYASSLGGWKAYRVVDTVFRTSILINESGTLAALGKMPEGYAKSNAAATVLNSLAETDPQKALALWDNKTIKGNPNMLSAVFSAWAKNDPRAAAAEWTQRSEGPGSQMALSGLMTSWAQMEPKEAFAWAKSQSKATDRNLALQSCVTNLTQKDPQEALQMVETLTGMEKANGLRSIAEAWSEADPAKAEEWVRTRTNVMEKAQMLTQLAGNLSYINPGRAFSIGTELPKGRERMSVLSQAFSLMSYSDTEAANSLLEKVSGFEQKQLRESLIYRTAWQDPDKAMAMLKEHQPDDPADDMYSSMAYNLAQKDPDKALTWIKGLSDPASQRKAYPSLFGNWAYTAPQAAATAAQALTDKTMRTESLTKIGSTWASADHEKALAWAQSLTGSDRSAAMGAVLASAVGYQPKEITPQILEALKQLPAGESLPDSFLQAATGAARSMVAEDPKQAAAWAQQLPQEKCRDEVTANVAKQWVEQDVLAASQWIAELPEGLGRDKSVGALIPQIAQSDPSSAFAWANSVQDSGIRSQMLEQTFQQWKRADSQAAQNAINASPWTDAEKQRWTQVLK